MSKYDDFLEELKRNHNTTVKSSISKLYELLKEEDPNLSRDDMYDRIMKDCLEIWRKQTILNNMIDELKDPERQEAGKRGIEKRREISVTNNGSVATESVANNSSDLQTEPKSSSFQKVTNFEEDKKNIYEANHSTSSVYYSEQDAKRESRLVELQLENGRLREQLKEQKEQVQELIKSVNNAANIKKDRPDSSNKREDSTEIASLKAQLFETTRERDELKQLETLRMRENPGQTFQTAANVRPESFTVEMATNDASKFFKALKDSLKVIYITIENNRVIGFESDAKRQQGDQVKAAA